MDVNRKQYQHRDNRTSYIEGNTVRKLNAVPDIRREERPTHVPSRQRQVQRQPRGMSGMNFASLMVLTIAIIATVSVCFEYLKIQTEVSRMEKSIVTLERQLITLTNENDAVYASVNKSYDLDEIYRIAVEEYGMVYPDKNTVITYEASNDEYVRQYEDIPD